MDQKREFLWGAATAAHQVEGGNIHNDWWAWEQTGAIKGGERSGQAADHWHRFKEDLKLASGLKMNSYRFSIEWSRIEPREGQWDESALDWYAGLIAECEHLGLMPMMTLHHFSSPQWFAEKGGFTWDGAPDSFERFVRKVVERLGSRVPLWCTVNEPMVLAVGSYIAKIMPPAVYEPKKASLAAYNLLRCHVRAYDVVHAEVKRREGPWADRPLEVGFAHNMVHFIPDRSWHPLEIIAAKAFHWFYNQAWLDAVTGRRQWFGIPGLVPRAPVAREALGRVTCDFIGLNYYMKTYVQWRPPGSKIPVGAYFARAGEPVSDMGWALHPKGFAWSLDFMARYKLPIYVTENGMADHDDDLRPGFIEAHLAELAEAIDRGIDVRGYYYWSLIDNFEWSQGFDPRFGLFRIDYKTLSRTQTQSAALYRRIIEEHAAAGKSRPDRSIFRRLEGKGKS